MELNAMNNANFGFSNPYLKIGATLVLVALAAIAWTSFFAVGSELQAAVRNLGGLLILSGSVIYVIGRVVQAKHSRRRA